MRSTYVTVLCVYATASCRDNLAPQSDNTLQQSLLHMFVFVAGIQPKVETETVLRDCPQCGRGSLLEKRVDQVLQFFFLPVFTLQKGQPYYTCEGCGWDSREAAAARSRPVQQLPWSETRLDSPGSSNSRIASPPPTPSAPPLPLSCRSCGHAVQPEYLFCPFCGTFLKE